MKRIYFFAKLTLSEKRKFAKQLRDLINLEEFSRYNVEIRCMGESEEVYALFTFKFPTWNREDVETIFLANHIDENDFYVTNVDEENNVVEATIVLRESDNIELWEMGNNEIE